MHHFGSLCEPKITIPPLSTRTVICIFRFTLGWLLIDSEARASCEPGSALRRRVRRSQGQYRVSRQRIKHKTHSVGHLRVPVYPYGTPNGSERGPGWHAKSDRRAQTTSRGDGRSPRAAHHRDRTREHDQIGPGGDLVRPRHRACRPKNGRLTTRRVRRRARSAAPRSARSAAATTRSGVATPLPTCPAPAPRRCVDRAPAAPPGGRKDPLPCRPQDGRRIGAGQTASTRTRAPWQTDADIGLAARSAAHHRTHLEEKPRIASGVEVVGQVSRAPGTSDDGPNSCAISAAQRVSK
jgi:hypothetical protein